MNDRQILAAVKTGQMQFFGQIYDRYSKQIYKYIYNRVSNKDIAEDILSETFLKSLKNINNVRADQGTLAPWLYKIASNLIIDYYRFKKPTVDIENIKEQSSDEDASALATDGEMFLEAQQLLNSLNKKQKEIVIMRLWDGLSYKEIMEITGIKEGNCKVIFSRALATLKSAYGPMAILLLLTKIYG